MKLITKKTKKKVDAKRNRPQDPFGKKALPVTQYDDSGKRIANFPSLRAAQIATGTDITSLSRQLKHGIFYLNGSIWKYGQNKTDCKTITPKIQRRIKSQGLNEQVITQYDRAGNKIRESKNLKAAAKAAKVPIDPIRRVLLGERDSALGFIWKLGKGKQVISTTHLAEWKEKWKIKRCKPVFQYDLNGNRVGHYESIAEATRACNANPGNINGALNSSHRDIACGFIWRFGKGPKKIQVSESIRQKSKLQKTYDQPVTQYNLKGKRIAVYPNFFTASEKTKIEKYWITSVISGKKLMYKGSIWRSGKGPSRISIDYIVTAKNAKKGNSKRMIQYDMKRKKIKEYPSIKEAARITKISSYSLRAAARGEYKSAGGFIWKYS